MIHTESTFETAIIKSLITEGGYTQGDASTYTKSLALFRQDIFQFIQTTQAKAWDKLSQIHGKDVENKFLQRLYNELDLRGSLDVLRNGIKDYGVKFDMAYFQPVSDKNPDTIVLYHQNLLKVTQQVHYSEKNKNSVDLMLSLNGIPVATLELKNEFTGQNVQDATKQYNLTRSSQEVLFAFKKRCLVHFSVDADEVYMTTQLKGKDTYWLPFNKGLNEGKGNPIDAHSDYRTAYLWRDILKKDSWMNILQQFIHLQREEYEVNGRTKYKEKLIFPRYHQLDVVRQLTATAKAEGAGHNYLIQHSAGSGKSNSIAWLAYRLSSLHDADDNRIFNSVIVITDRRVLDSQLQDTIYQFDHKAGVVQKIDEQSSQLAAALNYGKNIIITTLQKFPHIIDKVQNLPDRNYAIIVDEAHSSQTGESAKKMKAALSNSEEVEYNEDFINVQAERSAQARGKQSNLSFFAFTATPKPKTLGIFGRDKKPFHLYSMCQAIEEGFILDVLKNYTTYTTYFKIAKAIEDDPELEKKRTTKAIAKAMTLHPTNIAQKTEVIIEHFRANVLHKIGGLAKAMVVTHSRKHAVRYYFAFKEYIERKGYEKEMKVLVAFSGQVIDDGYPDGVSEKNLTGYGINELPEIFGQEEYKVLIVADKYQTGFDQPLLHTMYVDKKLSGVKAVQTLSRVNRTHPGKDDTFILDFVNEEDEILAAFQPYYIKTIVKELPDPNHLYDLKYTLDEKRIYLAAEVEHFARIFFKTKHTSNDQAKLYNILDPALDRFKQLPTEEEQADFKSSLMKWVQLYAYIAQIMPFIDTDFEKFYIFAKYLIKRLPKKDSTEAIDITDEITLEYYRLQKINEGQIKLEKDEEGVLDGSIQGGMKKSKDEAAPLSEIIKLLNERFGTQFEEADRLFFEQLKTALTEDEELKSYAKANPIETFGFAFEDSFTNKLIDRMEQNQEIFEKILGDNNFGEIVRGVLMREVYSILRNEIA